MAIQALLVILAVLLVLLFLGVPISYAIAVSSLTAILSSIDLNVAVLTAAQRTFVGMSKFSLTAIPFFILAGNIMNQGGIAKRLVDFVMAILGKLPGALLVTNIGTNALFGAISGSGPATTAAVGMLMIPAMAKRGYNVGYAAAATATAGGIGIIIPPSIPMVIYGVSGQQSISKMFMAGIIPGILIAVGLSVMHFFLCRNLKTEGLDWSMKTFIHSLRDGFWSILAPVIILGGIYAGIFTPTEAAVVAIFYTILVGIFIHKELTLKSFMASLKTTSWLTGRVLVLVFTATAFGYLLTSYRIPVEIANWILSFTNNVNLVWFFVVILLLFLGMFMETLAIIMLVTPVLLPIMTAYGVDPIHFGIILICCCGIGFSTPPLGENMFIASGIANISLEEISLKALPLVAINIAVIAILVMFPDIVLFLPNLMGTGLQ